MSNFKNNTLGRMFAERTSYTAQGLLTKEFTRAQTRAIFSQFMAPARAPNFNYGLN